MFPTRNVTNGLKIKKIFSQFSSTEKKLKICFIKFEESVSLCKMNDPLESKLEKCVMHSNKLGNISHAGIQNLRKLECEKWNSLSGSPRA